MKVKELITILQTCNPDDLVILAGDSEGNDYFTLQSLGDMAYYAGDVKYRELTPEMKGKGYTEEDIADARYVNAVVLWP